MSAKNPEATKVSDEEYQEVDCTPVVVNISERNVEHTRVLNRMADGCLIATWILLN